VWVVDEGWSGLRRIAPDARDVSFSVAYGGYFRSLSVDRVRDRVWAANPTLDQVVAVDGTGTVVGVIAVSSPLKVAADESDGSVWVVGSWGVARFDTSGARTFEDPAPSNPKDIVVDALREIVWVADGGTGEGGSLWMREADGTTVHVFGFDYPFALSVDGEGKVWVVDAYSGRVYRVDPDAPGTALSVGDFAQPVDVAASPDGGAWVADWDAGAVVRLGPDLERLETVRGFDRPRAVAVSVCDTTLWVTEAYGGRVVKVGRDGERLGQVGGLDFPKDIALGVGSPCPGRGRSGLDKPRPL
jgi:sugar lactone lactonase YvrE